MEREPLNIKKKYPTKNWKEIWTNAHKKFLDTEVRSFLYKAINETFVTRTMLNQFGIANATLCPDCLKPDTFSHRFKDCRYKNIWEVMKKRVLDLASSHRTFNDEELLKMEIIEDNEERKNAIIFFVANTMFYIWKVEHYGRQKTEGQWKVFLRQQRFKIRNVNKMFKNHVKDIV